MENTKKISKWPLVSATSFLGYSWYDVQLMFRIKGIEYGNIITRKFELGNECVDQVLYFWKCLSSVFSPSSFPGENEAERKLFTGTLLSALPVWDNFTMGLDYPLKNTSISGILDFAIIAYASYPSIVCVNEAKDADMIQGRAQAYLQMRSCYEFSKKAFEVDGQQNMKYPFYVYGIVTNVVEWDFIRYDGETWVQAETKHISSSLDKDGIKEVLSYVYNILMCQHEYLEKLE